MDVFILRGTKMKLIDKIKNILIKEKNKLKKDFYIKKIGIFGSFVRGEEKKPSDVDILVDFSRIPGLLKFIEIEEYLSKLLKIRVDLVMKSSLKPNIGQHILNEVIYL